MMTICEHAEVPRHVKARGRHEATQAREELVRAHVGMGSAAAPRGLEVDAHAAALERLDGVVREGRAEHVPAQALELLAVTAVDGRRGVQLHAEGGHRQRRPGRGLGRRRQVRAGERELHARRQRGVDVGARVVDLCGGGDGLVDLREHSLHPLRGRRRRRQEAHVGDALVVRPVGDEAVQVHVEAEVAAEPLHRREHARVQRRHRRQAMALLHGPPHVPHHRLREALGDLRQQRLVVAQAHGHRPLEREHPLSVAHRRQHVVDQQRGSLGHPPADASTFVPRARRDRSGPRCSWSARAAAMIDLAAASQRASPVTRNIL
jgi:hypothetical protein